jgi:hypothetical protein
MRANIKKFRIEKLLNETSSTKIFVLIMSLLSTWPNIRHWVSVMSSGKGIGTNAEEFGRTAEFSNSYGPKIGPANVAS